MDEELRDPEYQNFVSIYRGFSYVGKQLEPYTCHGLDQTYQHIYKKLAGSKVCQQQCSEKYKSQTSKWCASCKNWRNLLLKSRKTPNVAWEETQSWEWPKAYQNIAEIYLPASWQKNDIDFKDITTACFIWENCSKQFLIRSFIIKKLREYRNKYFAHNASLKATTIEKTRVFDILMDLLKDPDVQGHINAHDCMKELTKIEKGYQIDQWMNEVQVLLQQHGLTLEEVEKSQKCVKDDLNKGLIEIHRSQKYIEKEQESLRMELVTFKEELTSLFNELQKSDSVIFHRTKSKDKTFGRRLVITSGVILVIICLLCTFAFIYQKHPDSPKTAIRKGCVSEQYSIPFPQDLPLIGYLYEHKALTGRYWLMEQLNMELIIPGNSQQNGIVLIADMGYGKSAFVSNLLCPGSNELAIAIQKHIVAFHICRFDVRSTTSTGRFVRRLVGFFSMKNAEYGNIISMLPESSILFNRDSCEKESEACFDQGIAIPIKQLKDIQDAPWIVVIDAVDECEISAENPLLELLASRISRLPKWIKFVLTSRNITSLKLLRKLKFEYLLTTDPRNKEDIKQFIYDSFPSTANPRVVSELVDKSEGSFVYVIQALQWMKDRMDSETVPEFPSELSDIYEINFDRQFKTADVYTVPKAILEIACSTRNPLSADDIYTILKSDNSSLKKNDFEISFKALSFFLRIDKNVRLFHQSLYHWLISDQNPTYQISLQAGHTFISKYMFGTIGKNKTQDIVDLAIHVANTDDPSLENMFVSTAILNGNETNFKVLPHKLIWKTSSSKALGLLLKYYPDVNLLNEGNVTPAFVAAAKGHIGQLKLLHKKGAYLDFTVDRDFFISPYSVFHKIEMMKQQYYAGYSLLHIAAQHGHVQVIDYILSFNVKRLYERNAMGLHIGHTACENGHINVIEKLYELDSNIFDEKCMLYAAKENHVNILRWLTKKGIEFKCISDAKSLDAAVRIEHLSVEKIVAYPHVYFPFDVELYEKINPLDEWWDVLKIDSLNVAIRYGSLDAAKYLIITFPHSLECSDAFGFTAALASIFYNRTGLLPFLHSNLESDRCAKVPEHVHKMESIQHVRLWEMDHQCPEGGSVAHVISLYTLDIEIVFYCIKEMIAINWNEEDSNGNFPVHYAVANGNIYILLMFKKSLLGYKQWFREADTSYKELRALNGSTVYHIAAISGHVLSMYVLTNNLLTPIPDLRDKFGRTVLHYLGLKVFQNIVGESDEKSQIYSLHSLRYLVEVSNHNITASDVFGRNVLHYALKCGNGWIVEYFHYMRQDGFDFMLSQKDNDGLTPVDFAIRSHVGQSIMILPLKFSFPDIFYECCNSSADYSKLMSSWELGLLFLIRISSTSKYYKYFEPNLKLVMEKSPYLLTALMVYHNCLDDYSLRRHVLSVSDHTLPIWSQFTIARHRPSALVACGTNMHNSPLHFIALTMEHKNTVFSLDHIDVQAFLRFVNGTKYSSKFGCEDDIGYNIFHYSLIGGNIQTARILMWNNILTTNKKVSVKDVFLLALLSRLRKDNNNFVKCSNDPSEQNQIMCTDIFLHEYFETHKTSFKFSTFCNSRNRELSLVHLLAANGMTKTLNVVTKMFGQKILTCTNRDNFTPYYFGKLFCKDSDLPSYLHETEVLLPGIEAEEWLLWSMLNRFPHENRAGDLFHLLRSISSVTHLKARQILHCQVYLKRLLQEKKRFAIFNIFYHLKVKTIITISSDLKTLVTCNRYLENVYYNHKNASVVCGFNMFQISRCYMWFRDLNKILHYGHFISNAIHSKEMSKAFLRFSEFYKDTKRSCKEKKFNVVRQERKLINAMLSLNRLVSRWNNILTEKAISYYIQARKSLNIEIPDSFKFLQSRTKNILFNINTRFHVQTEILPLLAMSPKSPFKYMYLGEIKQSLAYKHVMDRFRVNKYGLDPTHDIRTYKIEYRTPKEPFGDLRKVNPH